MASHRIIGIMMATAVLLATSAMPAAQAKSGGQERNWLMVVKSLNTDPAREDEFTYWYDEIDVPDVLEVPGYMRARRGERVDTQADTGETDADDGYVALYDIHSANLDKTIIAMLMASWRMDQLGRSTDLIKVVERLYYRRASEPVPGNVSGDSRWLLLVRTHQLPSTNLLQQLAAAGRFERATPYELDRVLMHEPHAVPRHLTMFELAFASRDEALAAAREITAAIPNRDHGIYDLIKDAARP